MLPLCSIEYRENAGSIIRSVARAQRWIASYLRQLLVTEGEMQNQELTWSRNLSVVLLSQCCDTERVHA